MFAADNPIGLLLSQFRVGKYANECADAMPLVGRGVRAGDQRSALKVYARLQDAL